jgi:hypothetical protein
MTDLRNRIDTLAEEGRSVAKELADEARDDAKAVVVELHQIGRKAAERVKEAEATTVKTLKLVD